MKTAVEYLPYYVDMQTEQSIESRKQICDEYESNCYLFSPSIGKRKTVGGKTYYVRRYFRGGKDFEKTMEQLATKQLYKNAR